MNTSLKKAITDAAIEAAINLNNQTIVNREIPLSDDFDSAALSTVNGDISVKKAEKFMLRLQITTRYPEKELLSFNISDKTLTLRPKTTTVDGMDITFCLPKTKLKNLALDTDNGKVSIDRCQIDSLKIKGHNMPIKLSHISFNNAKFHTDNANIILSDVTVTGADGKIDGKCHNGKIKILFASQALNNCHLNGELSSANGKCSIKLPNLQQKKEEKVVFSYGDSVAKTIGIKLDTTNENIKLGVYEESVDG